MTDSQTPGALAVYRRLLGYSAPHWRVFLVAVLGMVVFASVDVSFARLVQPLTDSTFGLKNAREGQMLPWIILGLFVCRGAAAFLSSYGMAWVSQKVVLQLRGEVFDQILHLPVSHHDRVRNADLLVKLTYHVNQVSESASSVITSMIKDSLTIIGLLFVMSYNSWKLTLITLTLVPVVAWSVRYVSKRFKMINQRLQQSMGSVTHVADEAITGRRVVKVYGGEAAEVARFKKVGDYIRVQSMKLVASSSGAGGFVQFIAAFAISLIVFLAGSTDMLRQDTAGTFVSFMAALLMMRAPLNSLSGVNERLSRGLTAAADLFAFLDTPREADAGTRTLARAAGAIAFEDVRFAYGEDKGEALAGLSLSIRAGQTVAFVGRSGSGKSTLLSLLPRFYDPTGGRVLLDGVDLREYRLADLRRQIALVDQNIVLFNGTVAENIAYGCRERAADADIISAAKAAYAWDFIEKLPQGIETQVGQDGLNLSGGQRQRIAIARALYKNAPILILDEATSALDTESERYIQAGLEQLVQGRTTLVIAHRLSTIQRADLIVVMQQGRIVEQGRHDELLARGGAYASLHSMQFRDEPAPVA
ncbi:MAG TPA: lipid A export permease/ATP-binding protein MsbA [Nevskiaceae bacterium]|nr:lipid A export permease/ATP-binding protein MsbA [Nevskiaceae bacterium]